MDKLTPLHVKSSKCTHSGQRCVATWGEFLDDNAVHSEESSKEQDKPPFKDADMPLCQDLLWGDYGEKQRRRQQAQSASTSSAESSSSATSNPQHSSVWTGYATKDDSLSDDDPGAPWDVREYIKLGGPYVRHRMNPIDNFWLRPEACYEALERMAAEVALEPQSPENEEPETSFWSYFKTSADSSPPKTAAPSPVLFSIEEQKEDEEPNNMLPTLEPLSQQDQLNDQDDINVSKLNGMIGSMEETVSSPMAYENKSAAKLAHGDQLVSQECTQTVDLKKDDKKDHIEVSNSPEPDVISNEQEQITDEPKRVVDVDQTKKTVDMMSDKAKEGGMYDMQKRRQKSTEKQKQPQQQDVAWWHKSEGSRVRMQQYNPQLTTFKEPIEIVVRLSDMIQGPHRPKVQLADLVEPSSTPPAKHQARKTLADLL